MDLHSSADDDFSFRWEILERDIRGEINRIHRAQLSEDIGLLRQNRETQGEAEFQLRKERLLYIVARRRLSKGHGNILVQDPESPTGFTSDPERIVALLTAFWEEVWARKDIDEPALEALLARHLPRGLLGVMDVPSAEALLAQFKRARPSSPGPDGLGSACLLAHPLFPHAMARWAAERVEQALAHRADPLRPPPLPLEAILKLLDKEPKAVSPDGFPLLRSADFRPIAIYDHDVRGVQGAQGWALTQALSPVVPRCQRAWIPGRSMNGHIVAHNRWRHEEQAAGRPSLSLYIDRIQAFPRGSQKAAWVFLLYAGSGKFFAAGSITFAGPIRHRVSFAGRMWAGPWAADGFGQGSGLSCPMLLILMWIDHLVLREELDGLLRLQVTYRDFADDLVLDVQAEHLRDQWRFLAAAKRASLRAERLTGSRWSMEKTKLSPTRELDLSETALLRWFLALLGWTSLAVVYAFRYLGIWIGLKVTVADIFQDSLARGNAALASWRIPTGKHLQAQIWNVYILPVYAWPGSFYQPN